ncbi:hypothetical protein JCM11251_003964 [Rhodosporidiobolus azoricus]
MSADPPTTIPTSTPQSPEVAPVTDLSGTLGPVIMGQVATVLFYGILLSVFTRFLGSASWKRASPLLRGVMLVVIGLATVATGLGIHDLWHYASLVTDDIAVVLSGSMPQAVEPLISGVTGFTVQAVLVLRVAKVITNRYFRWAFIGLMLAGALLSFIASCFFTAYSVGYRLGTFLTVKDRLNFTWNGLFELWLFSGGAVDILITVTYIFALRKRIGGRTETSNSVLRLIALCAVRCAAYTSIVAIVGAVLAPIYPSDESFYAYAFWEPLAVLYALSLFTTLGVADSITAKLSDPALQRVSGPAGSGSTGSSGEKGNGNGKALPRFFVSPEVILDAPENSSGDPAVGLRPPAPPSIAPSRQSRQHRRIEDLDLDVDLDVDLERDYNDLADRDQYHLEGADGYSDAENGFSSLSGGGGRTPSQLGLGQTPSTASLTGPLSVKEGKKGGVNGMGGIQVQVERVEVEEKEFAAEGGAQQKRSY